MDRDQQRKTGGTSMSPFEYYLRTGMRMIAEVTPGHPLEVKLNPWHDPDDGRFTFAGTGRYFAGGGVGGGAGKRRASPKTAGAPAANRSLQPGGGSFGGGGASGSWGSPIAKAKVRKFRTPSTPVPLEPTIKPNVFRKDPTTDDAPALPPPDPLVSSTVGGYNFNVDGLKRTKLAAGKLRLEPQQPRSRTAQANAGGEDRLPGDHGGHYIGRRFGGPAKDINHFAQDASFNRGDYLALENSWAAALKSGKTVDVEIESEYEGNSRRPSFIRVRFKIDGKLREQRFPNTKGQMDGKGASK